MSKYVKNLVIGDLTKRLKDVDGVVVLNPRGIGATKNNQIRRKLHAAGARMTVVKNTLVKRATSTSKLKGFESLLDGPCALIYGAGVSKLARLVLDEKKTDEKMELRGAFFDGEVYAGQKGVEMVSKMPTREEAIANLVAAMLAPARKLAGVLSGPSGRIASILKTVEEKAAAAAPAEAAAAEAAPAV